MRCTKGIIARRVEVLAGKSTFHMVALIIRICKSSILIGTSHISFRSICKRTQINKSIRDQEIAVCSYDARCSHKSCGHT